MLNVLSAGPRTVLETLYLPGKILLHKFDFLFPLSLCLLSIFLAFNKSIASRVIRDEKCSTHQLPLRSWALRRFAIQPPVSARCFYLRRGTSTQVYKSSLFPSSPPGKKRLWRLLMPQVLKAKMFRMKIWNFWDGQLFVYFQLYVYFSTFSFLSAPPPTIT